MSRTKYTSIRVPVETAERLRAFANDLEDQAGDLKVTLPDKGNTGLCECPLWFAIDSLIDRVKEHRQRAKKSARQTAVRPCRSVAAQQETER
ncbi:MAG: hypothetical protein AAGH88_05520 [Planctomycetota bacterium]